MKNDKISNQGAGVTISIKIEAKGGIKLFLSDPFLLDLPTLFQIFCPGLCEQTNFWS